MGHKAIGRKAMTAAERQARRRKRLRKTRATELNHKLRLQARDARALAYIPMPPGITYWVTVKVKTPADEITEVWSPRTRPLAAIAVDLTDEDVRALLKQITDLARKRKLSALTDAELISRHTDIEPGPDSCVSFR